MAHQAQIEFGNGFEQTPISGTVHDLSPIRIITADQAPYESLWDQLMRQYHYLGHGNMPGRQLKQLAFSAERPIAAAGWRAASLKLASRDDFIGWPPTTREQFLSHLVNNSRFLILPWIRIANLGSYLLSQFVKELCRTWPAKYHEDIWLVETFVDPQHFSGTVYKAANWIHVGTTSGFTIIKKQYTYHGQPKEVFVYPLKRNLQSFVKQLPTPPRRRGRPPVLREGDLSMRLQNDDWHPGILEECGITAESVARLADMLVEFHVHFAAAFNRPAQLPLSITYLKGLLSNADRKSIEPIALRYLGPERVRALQRFMTESPVDDILMDELYLTRLSSIIADENGVLSVDSSEFPKQGKHSAGVSRQYCGHLGKRANCQSGVFVGYASTKGYGLLKTQLYIPEKWYGPTYDALWDECEIPDDLQFRTKPQIAGELIKAVKAKGQFPARWLACDATFGNDPAFRDAIALDFSYLAQIRANTLLWTQQPQRQAPADGVPGRRQARPQLVPAPCHAEDVAASDDTDWQTASFETARGPMIMEIARRRVIERRDDVPYQECWLFMRRDATGEVTYYFSNAPADVTLETMGRVSLMRWPIEQCFKEGKGQVGMDHYETRTWPSWHRHMQYVFLAMLFLLEVRYHFAKKGALSS
jgi:SRSO17 transposase